LLRRIAEQPDLTLDEIVVAMRKRRIAGSRSEADRLARAPPRPKAPSRRPGRAVAIGLLAKPTG